MSEEYIFIKVMTLEFNNQHHQHQGTYRGWCAWLNANPIPSYMIEASGNVTILESWTLLSLLNSEWDKQFYFLHMKFDEVGICKRCFSELSWDGDQGWFGFPPSWPSHCSGFIWLLVNLPNCKKREIPLIYLLFIEWVCSFTWPCLYWMALLFA